MTFYEYECDACRQIIEVLQSLSEPPLRDCPSGDGGKLTKLLSAHNVGRRASGFEAGPDGVGETVLGREQHDTSGGPRALVPGERAPAATT